jgi:hypothetical protein
MLDNNFTLLQCPPATAWNSSRRHHLRRPAGDIRGAWRSGRNPLAGFAVTFCLTLNLDLLHYLRLLIRFNKGFHHHIEHKVRRIEQNSRISRYSISTGLLLGCRELDVSPVPTQRGLTCRSQD